MTLVDYHRTKAFLARLEAAVDKAWTAYQDAHRGDVLQAGYDEMRARERTQEQLLVAVDRWQRAKRGWKRAAGGG